jgi:hypothetical protein
VYKLDATAVASPQRICFHRAFPTEVVGAFLLLLLCNQRTFHRSFPVHLKPDFTMSNLGRSLSLNTGSSLL